MSFAPVPATAAWHHRGARSGFEVAYFGVRSDGGLGDRDRGWGDLQTYARTADEASCQRYDYAAPGVGFAARLIYDESGLVLDYPGIAVRAG